MQCSNKSVLVGWLGAASATCYSGDYLGFVPCNGSEECDAPPRAEPRRACIVPDNTKALPGYCALPCHSDDECADEVPASISAVCAYEKSKQGYCAIPCSASDPACPNEMACRGYSGPSVPACASDTACACFPVK